MQLVDPEIGCYERPGWTRGDTGTYALILGVSRYEHLDGSARAHRLKSLFVSALTAYRFFEYMSQEYVYEKPTQRCWLLLAPTAEELAAEPRIGGAAAHPSFEVCRKAIRSWFASVRDIGADPDQISRSIFFFSGHGFEITDNNQMLLPADYLGPDGTASDAIATQKIRTAMQQVRTNDHFFFVDACRTDNEAIHKIVDFSPRTIVETTNEYVNRNARRPVLYAASYGGAAYEPKSPERGISIFGDALIGGLCEGDASIPLPNADLENTLSALKRYVSERVSLRLQRAGKVDVIDPVMLDGWRGEPIVSHAHAGRHSPIVPSLPTADSPASLAGTVGDAGHTDVYAFRNAHEYWPKGAPTTPFDQLVEKVRHDVLGSENMTKLFENSRIYDLDASSQTAVVVRIVGVERTKDTKLSRIAFEFDKAPGESYESRAPKKSRGWWVEWENAQGSFAVVIPPADPYQEMVGFTLEVGRRGHGKRKITSFQAYISLSQPKLDGATRGNVERIARLWRYMRATDPSAATQRLLNELGKEYFEMANHWPRVPLGDLIHLLYEKVTSPLSATVAASLLLPSGLLKPKQMRWIDNLAKHYSTTCDSSILAVEKMRTLDSGPWVATLSDAIRVRGLPYLRPTTSLLLDQLNEIEAVRLWGKGIAFRNRRLLTRFLLPGAGLLNSFAMPHGSAKEEQWAKLRRAYSS